MNFHSALAVVRDIIKANPDAMLVNEGANALDFTRSIVDMYKPRKRLDVGTWGVMGIGMGFSVAAGGCHRRAGDRRRGCDSAFGFSGMEVETICRYNLPVCVVILNNNGVYRGDEVNPDRRRGSVTARVRQGCALRKADGGVRRRRRPSRPLPPSLRGAWRRRSARAGRR
jgi:oxalyl-CoA decarboxylase